MTDERTREEGAPDETDEGGAPEVQSWLKDALRAEAAPPVDVLSGVQKKLRERSGGKFYADLWSTSKQPPIVVFLVTSAVMLVVVLVAYAVLAPLRGRPEPVRTEPAPIDVVAPPR
jgi:hypothetical protein